MTLPPTGKIAWGPGFANEWVFPGPVDNPLPLPEMVGQKFRADSGVSDYWDQRTDHIITLSVRFIPRYSRGGITGYSDQDTGVYHAVQWMWKNASRFYVDRNQTGYHVVELLEFPRIERERGGTFYRVDMRLRDVNDEPFLEY